MVLTACENAVASPATKVQRIEAQDPPLLVKKLTEHATLPKRGSDLAAGYDLSR